MAAITRQLVAAIKVTYWSS